MADSSMKKTGTLAKLFRRKSSNTSSASASGSSSGGSSARASRTASVLAQMEAQTMQREQKVLKDERRRSSRSGDTAAASATLKRLSQLDQELKQLKTKKGRQAAQRVRHGRLWLKASLQRTEAGSLALSLAVEEGRDLFGVNKGGTASTFIEAKLVPGGEAKRSGVVKDTLRPLYAKDGGKFAWSLPAATSLDGTRLLIQCANKDGGKRQASQGTMSFTLAEIEDSTAPVEGWYRLLDDLKGQTQNQPYRANRRQDMTADQRAIFAMDGGADSGTASGKNSASSKVANAKALGKLNEYNFIKVLGRGAFGKVVLAEDKKSKETVAIKILSKTSVVEDDDVENTMTERRVLAAVNQCPFMVHMMASFQTDSHLYFVMEFITGGDLMFHAQKKLKFTEPEARFILAEICVGVWFLHDHGIIYRDIKLDNIMFDSDGHVKLADFGLAKENMWGAATTTTFCGTPGYLAPEILRDDPYGKSIDWWSLGVLAYEMMVGNSPFEADDQEALFDLIVRGTIEYPSHLSQAAKSFLQGLLTREVNNRLGCGEAGRDNVEKHPFFADLEWEKLKNRELTPVFQPPKAASKLDVANFDPEFLTMAVDNTPVDQEDIDDIDQKIFKQFSFDEKTAEEEPQQTAPPLQGHAWYRPGASRQQAAEELKGMGVGRFVVRESASQPGCYAISVSMGDSVWHGVITPSVTADGNTLYKVFNKNKFESVEDLVEFYHSEPLVTTDDGQAVVLLDTDADDE